MNLSANLRTNAREHGTWFWVHDVVFFRWKITSYNRNVRGSYTVNPLSWFIYSIFVVFFPSTRKTYCNMNDHFTEENIIVNLTFCMSPFLLFFSAYCVVRDQFEGGDWAASGNVYQDSGRSSTCVCMLMLCYPIVFLTLSIKSNWIIRPLSRMSILTYHLDLFESYIYQPFQAVKLAENWSFIIDVH